MSIAANSIAEAPLATLTGRETNRPKVPRKRQLQAKADLALAPEPR